MLPLPSQREFTEAHELDRKWRVPKEMIGGRLSQEEAIRSWADDVLTGLMIEPMH